MAFQLSPGINVSEIDLTTIVPSVATSIGGIAGNFNWGPVNEVVTVSDEVTLVDRFGKPDSTNYEYWFSTANFLAYSNNLKIVRAANTTSTLNATANASGILIENESDYENNHENASNATYGPFAARWAGDLGNSLRVSICPSSQAFSANLSVTDSLRTNAVTSGTTVINVQGNANAAANIAAGDLISVNGGTLYVRVASVNATAIIVSTALTANVANSTPILKKWQYADEFGVAPGTSSYVTDKAGSGDEMHIIIIDEDGKFSGTANTVLEKYAFVSKASDAISNDGSSSFYKTVLNEQSRYVWWMAHQPGSSNWGTAASGTTYTNLRNPWYSSLSAGANGTIAAAQIITAYGFLSNPDVVDVSLLISGPGNAK